MSGSLGWNSCAHLSKSLSLLRLARVPEQSDPRRIACSRPTRDSIISPFCNNIRNRPADLSLASSGVAEGAQLARSLLSPSHHCSLTPGPAVQADLLGQPGYAQPRSRCPCGSASVY